MKRKIMKLGLISITGALDILLISIQILITTTNFKWSPWYDPENLVGMLLLLFHPVTWVIVIMLLCMNFVIEEMKVSGKMLLVSMGTYVIVLLDFDSTIGRFQLTSYFFTIFNTMFIVVIVIYVALTIIILVNTIRVFYKVIKEKRYSA